jgi:hypothetical protein
LVVPRAHDCITLFLGSKERYLEYFQQHPGVIYRTSGWIERGSELSQLRHDSIQQRSGITQSYEELAAKYGEDNARFLHEQLGNLIRNYAGVTYIEMGIEPDGQFERQARQEAEEHGLVFEILTGDMSLIEDLLGGDWGEDRFLVVPPGHRIAASFDELIIKAESPASFEKKEPA